MNDEKTEDLRSRDDYSLRELVSEARVWLRERGIEEKPLDWEEVVREEEAIWWQQRVQQAMTDLVSHSREFASSIGAKLRQLAQTTEFKAQAALEVTMDNAQQLARVLSEPAQFLVFPDAQLQFRHTLGGSHAADESTGLVSLSPDYNAVVCADVAQRSLSIDFSSTKAAPLIILIPEDSALPLRATEAFVEGQTKRATFDNLPSGRYMLCIYISEEQTLGK